MYGYGVISALLVAGYPLASDLWRSLDFLVLCVAGLACVVIGRHAVNPRRRLPWTLLASGLTVIVIANAVRVVPEQWTVVPRLLLDAAGNVLLLAAALAFIIRRGFNDLGGIIDTTIIALAVGGLLWGVVLPHRLAEDGTVAAQANLFVVVYALTGVLGALLRLTHTVNPPRLPLWWLGASIALGIGANVALALAGGSTALAVVAEMLFMAAFVAVGLFGLDPDSPQLFQATTRGTTEELSAGRLAFLGVAAAVMPVVIGVRELVGGPPGGLLLAIQGALVAALVMIRIGLLSAQRAEAERALRHQAAHDPLTHLPNRREFVQQLREELSGGNRCVVLFCDLDDFKMINDRFGHDTGDRLLIEVADRLVTCLDAPHLVSRFGGDEFVALLTNATPGEASAARARITDTLAQPSAHAGGAPIRVSVGVAVADQTRDAEELIRIADHDMYRRKAAARSRPQGRYPYVRPAV